MLDSTQNLTLFPYTTLFRSRAASHAERTTTAPALRRARRRSSKEISPGPATRSRERDGDARSEEHTAELQSHVNIVCRLLREQKHTSRNSVNIVYQS